MARSDFTEDRRWLLGQLDAPVRAARIREMFEQRLRPLLDWGFAVSSSDCAATVSLGSVTLVTAYCESDPPNADSVRNFVATCVGPGEFRPETLFVEDKSSTPQIALEQLEHALVTLRTHREEIATPNAPTGWAYNDEP